MSMLHRLLQLRPLPLPLQALVVLCMVLFSVLATSQMPLLLPQLHPLLLLPLPLLESEKVMWLESSTSRG